jgi:hypothetical protein
MSGRLLEKYANRPMEALAGEPEGEVDDLGAFGFLRGMQTRSLMVELRKRDGEVLAVGCAFIDRIFLDPSEGITLHCGSRTISIRGKNLNKEIRPNVTLFLGLTRSRVPWIAEADQAIALQAPNDAVIVESIKWE